MVLNKRAFAFLISVFLLSGSSMVLAQQTAPVEVKTTAEAAVVPATSEISADKPAASTSETKVSADKSVNQPAATEKTAEVTVPPVQTSSENTTGEVKDNAVKPIEPAKTAETAVSGSGLSAKDFVLKQEELAYGVSLVQKGIKKIPFKDNPAVYDTTEKDKLQEIAKRLFPDDNLKNLGSSLNSIAITLLTSKKDDKDLDYGLVSLELSETAKKDFDTIKTNIKNSMLVYFKGENFFIHDKFPIIVILAPNLPDNKKEDIQWASELIQKKLSSK
ncbi:MAG: hypothetical protein QMC67_15295 [Candidatus Wallbacteria bacterium]